MQLANKTCLIVGASGTIGRAVAESFYKEGARTVLTFRFRRKEALSKSLPARDPRIASYKLDVCDPKNIHDVVDHTIRKFGPINVLVNCSGVLGPIGATHEISAAHWRQAIEINLLGSFYLLQAILPSMLTAGGGKIIQFSGGGAAHARPFFTAYSASKAALVRFTESLAAELFGKNIQINAIAPGPVESRMWDELRASGTAGGAQAIEELKKMEQTGGVPPKLAAGLAVFLASDRSNGLSGRLISAVHDKWDELPPRISEIMSTDAGTLRRIPLD